ncbi:polyprenyl diphosphate synthase [Phycisphaera mikurensis]|nr:polyprenyl diphosphate synthase [Phycisphaera mikurensis]MBB6441744.1 undecaprenyl diphosphate synthase [Phycisphaera mikurensis]
MSIPRHLAVIMDGNGRWATSRGKPRSAGHTAGVEAVRPLVTRCRELGVEAVSLYSFSTENWAREKEEVHHLMRLCVAYLASELPLFQANGIRLRRLGAREGLPAEVLDAFAEVEEATAANDAMTLCLAINYGSRAEIVAAARTLARRAVAGGLDPAAIDEAAFSAELTTAGLPDPDLLIRTAGEMRLSNFLLWQLSYAELYVTDTLWPDFDNAALAAAFASFHGRVRRFGGVPEVPTPST